jgi:hypothetical protein
LVTLWAWLRGHLSANLVGLAAIASIVPFGPFVIDRKLKAVEAKQGESGELREEGNSL